MFGIGPKCLVLPRTDLSSSRNVRPLPAAKQPQLTGELRPNPFVAVGARCRADDAVFHCLLLEAMRPDGVRSFRGTAPHRRLDRS